MTMIGLDCFDDLGWSPHNAIENPYDSKQSVSKKPARASSSRLYDNVSPFLEELASSFKLLRGRLTPEILLGDIVNVAESFHHGIPNRPEAYSKVFDRVHLSNIPGKLHFPLSSNPYGQLHFRLGYRLHWRLTKRWVSSLPKFWILDPGIHDSNILAKYRYLEGYINLPPGILITKRSIRPPKNLPNPAPQRNRGPKIACRRVVVFYHARVSRIVWDFRAFCRIPMLLTTDQFTSVNFPNFFLQKLTRCGWSRYSSSFACQQTSARLFITLSSSRVSI